MVKKQNILKEAKEVTNFVTKNKQLPNYVTMENVQYSTATYVFLLCSQLINLINGAERNSVELVWKIFVGNSILICEVQKLRRIINATNYLHDCGCVYISTTHFLPLLNPNM